MAEPYVGEIRLFGFTFAPSGWAMCDGQIMQVSQNEILYCLLGSSYGGDGTTTFGLPDMRGRVPIHQGYGMGLSPRYMGDKIGVERVALDANTMPQHSHTVTVSSSPGNTASPAGAMPAQGPTAVYGSDTSPGELQQMNTGTIEQTGAGQVHENMMPSLAVHYCIALQGDFPSRS